MTTLSIEIPTYIERQFKFLLTNRKDYVKKFDKAPAEAINRVIYTIELTNENPLTIFKLGKEWGKILSQI